LAGITEEFPVAENPHSTAQVAGHPIHPMVIGFPIACLVLTLVSDITFYATSNEFWATASFWLLGIGLVMGALAAGTDLHRCLRRQAGSPPLGYAGACISIAIALLISLYNWYTRFEHGSSAVVPAGLVLSIIVVLVLLVAGWKGGEMVFRHSVGVAD
jgi:uncharacterized membrane protein